jgi:5-keto-L-gluconate epimerase
MKKSIVLSIEPEIKPLGLGGNFEKNAQLISELGYDGAELLIVNLDHINIERIKNITEQNNLTIAAIGSHLYYRAHGLSLCSSNPDIRRETINRVMKTLALAKALNSNITIGAGQGAYDNSYDEGFHNLVESLKECSCVAKDNGVLIFIEIINRYLPALIRTIGQGMKLIDAIGSPSIKILADTHHMNIEEKSLSESIKSARGYISYMHFSDSNRLPPGQGHINFHEIMEALTAINYNGFITAEFIPEPDPTIASKQAIQFLNNIS